MSNLPGIVVLEREPYWAPELRRQFEAEDVVVRHCTDLASVGSLDAGPQDVLVTSIDGNEQQCTELLRHTRGYFKILLGSPATAELESSFREAGAGSFCPSHISGEQLARRIRRIWCSVR